MTKTIAYRDQKEILFEVILQIKPDRRLPNEKRKRLQLPNVIKAKAIKLLNNKTFLNINKISEAGVAHAHANNKTLKLKKLLVSKY